MNDDGSAAPYDEVGEGAAGVYSRSRPCARRLRRRAPMRVATHMRFARLPCSRRGASARGALQAAAAFVVPPDFFDDVPSVVDVESAFDVPSPAELLSSDLAALSSDLLFAPVLPLRA